MDPRGPGPFGLVAVCVVGGGHLCVARGIVRRSPVIMLTLSAGFPPKRHKGGILCLLVNLMGFPLKTCSHVLPSAVMD